MRHTLPLQKPSRGDARQVGDGPGVDVGPAAGRAVFKRHGQQLPDIFGRLGKAFAAGLVHIEFAQQFAGCRSRNTSPNTTSSASSDSTSPG